MLTRARRAVLACTRAMAVVAMAVVGVMMLTITYDVLARFLFAAPTDWAYPLNSVGVLVATMLAVPHLWATGHHISMDLVHRALPPAARRVADVVTTVATCFLGVVLAVTAFRAMVVAYTGGLTGAGTFNIPLWVPDAVLFVTGVFLVLAALLFPPSPTDDVPAAVPGDVDVRAEQQGAAPLTGTPGATP
ncbi:TRAP transporter small permease [Pseudonocardia xinjiangensis]|uniref:TRAP transporter small permease n=1 Tax=Pseudonocardia xinjiangensis TaxID=75289 RepID=UPI003D8A98F5